MELPESVLVAGATGTLGRHVTRKLREQGARVRAMGRNAERLRPLGANEVRVADALSPLTLPDAVAGVDAVFSCLGGTVAPNPLERTSFRETDEKSNRNLIDAAVSAGVKRFTYVSVYGAERLPELEFTRSHENVVDYAKQRGLKVSVVRPTAFFAALTPLLHAARVGLLPMVDEGSARLNPIHEEELADVCLEALGPAPKEIDVGGPLIYTRREIGELAFQATGKTARMPKLPKFLASGVSAITGKLHPRLGHLTAFAVEVLTRDCVAPARGKRTLDLYFRERVKQYGWR